MILNINKGVISNIVMLIIFFLFCFYIFVLSFNFFSQYYLITLLPLLILSIFLQPNKYLYLLSISIFMTTYCVGYFNKVLQFYSLDDSIKMSIISFPLFIFSIATTIVIGFVLRKRFLHEPFDQYKKNYVFLILISLPSIFLAFFAHNILSFEKSVFDILLALALLLLPGYAVGFTTQSSKKYFLTFSILFLTITMSYAVGAIGWPESFLLEEHFLIFLKFTPLILFCNIFGVIFGRISNKMKSFPKTH